MNAQHASCPPFLRWAGSKRKLIPELSSYFPSGARRYVEPFAGSACLFFHLRPESALLADLNSDLINAYRIVQSDVEFLIHHIHRLPIGERHYYRIRALDPVQLSPVEQAARFIYLNRYCFNGLYRTNREGQFNVPYGDSRATEHINEQRLRRASSILQDVQLVSGDFSATLQMTLKGDFVYLDPPYRVSHRRTFSEYQATEFSIEDLERLQRELMVLDERGVSFLVSYAASPEARLLTKRWRWQPVETRRSIAGFCGSRGTAHEVLVTNLPERGNYG